MKLRRLLRSLAAAATLTATAFALAAPATAAANKATITITPSGANPLPGSLDPHGIQVQAKATCSDPFCTVDGLSLTISGPDGQVGAATGSNDSLSSASASYTWDTQPQAKRNGSYTISASANEGGTLNLVFKGPFSNSVAVKLNNPPAAPSGVKSAIDPSSNVPVVTWNANPEPDITGYEVFRSGDGAGAAAFSTKATSFQDNDAPRGKAVSYVVVAVRNSPVYSGGITSCNTQAPCQSPPTGNATPAVNVPDAAPLSVATADPASGSKAAGPVKEAVVLSPVKPAPIAAPSLPTKVVQLPAPNVVQFAPLLPYSGKIPEVAVTTTDVPSPVQAGDAGRSTLALPGTQPAGGTPVNAVKYAATAAFLVVAALHITRLARKLTASL
jgi:hypothetical protein